MKKGNLKFLMTLFLLFLLIPGVYTQIRFDLKSVPDQPALFAKGLISTGLYERDLALSPDGTELFYTLQSPQGVFQSIVYLKKDKQGNWSTPQLAPFAGNFSDLEPAFSPDGKKLYFSSNRPLGGSQAKDFDIWLTEKVNGQWSSPKNLGSPVNTPADEYYPCITRSGNLYFTAAYSNAIGKEDIYQARWQNGMYLEPLPLDSAVNSKMYEFNAFVSPDEDYILFTSYGRPDDRGRGDLYISQKDKTGQWLAAKNLAAINSDKLDYCPFVSFDKKILFFTSEKNNLIKTYPDKPVVLKELIRAFTGSQNGGGDIYWISFDALLKNQE